MLKNDKKIYSTMNTNELKKLLKKREIISYSLIEAKEEEYNNLNKKLYNIEIRIEQLKTKKGN